MPGHSRCQRGLGLAELMVVMGIMVTIMVLVSALYLQGRDGVRVSTERLDTSGRARRAMDALSPFVVSAIRDLRPALEVRDILLGWILRFAARTQDDRGTARTQDDRGGLHERRMTEGRRRSGQISRP